MIPSWLTDIHHEVAAGMTHGRLAMLAPEESTALARSVYLAGDLDHVEIGMLWGATAIIAALVKEREGLGGHVYTIDPQDVGYWQVGDRGMSDTNPPMPTALKALQNMQAFGVDHRISMIAAKSSPWPLPPLNIIGTVLIDGDHTMPACLCDWDNATQRALERILVHDYDTVHGGVKVMVETYANKSFDFTAEYQAGCMLVYQRTMAMRADLLQEAVVNA